MHEDDLSISCGSSTQKPENSELDPPLIYDGQIIKSMKCGIITSSIYSFNIKWHLENSDDDRKRKSTSKCFWGMKLNNGTFAGAKKKTWLTPVNSKYHTKKYINHSWKLSNIWKFDILHNAQHIWNSSNFSLFCLNNEKVQH